MPAGSGVTLGDEVNALGFEREAGVDGLQGPGRVLARGQQSKLVGHDQVALVALLRERWGARQGCCGRIDAAVRLAGRQRPETFHLPMYAVMGSVSGVVLCLEHLHDDGDAFAWIGVWLRVLCVQMCPKILVGLKPRVFANRRPFFPHDLGAVARILAGLMVQSKERDALAYSEVPHLAHVIWMKSFN